MSELQRTLIDVAKNISTRPAMYARTPEHAHGLIEAIAWVILHRSSDMEIEKCMREVSELVKKFTQDIDRPENVSILLCDESYPQRATSFDSFQVHTKRFIELLEEITTAGGKKNETA